MLTWHWRFIGRGASSPPSCRRSAGKMTLYPIYCLWIQKKKKTSVAKVWLHVLIDKLGLAKLPGRCVASALGVIIAGVKVLRSTLSAQRSEIDWSGRGVTSGHWHVRSASSTCNPACFVLSLQAAHSGGHKTLLYGHAILLRHSFSSMVRDGTRLPPIA